MNESTLTEQLRALYEEIHLPKLAPDEFTCGMFRVVTGCKKSTAETLLAKAIAEGGIAVAGDRIYQGRRVKAYRFVNRTLKAIENVQG